MALRLFKHQGTVIALALAAGLPAGHALAAPSLNTLWTFTGGVDSAGPLAPVVIDRNGILYGTTIAGGSKSQGTIYMLTPPGTPGGNWTESMIYSFAATAGDGKQPVSALIIDSGGNLYGTTTKGGANTKGTVFKLAPPVAPSVKWTETVLYSFSTTGINDGNTPNAGVVMDSFGNLYGTTTKGGTSNKGTVFKLTPPGTPGGVWTETVLYNFTGGADGGTPLAGLVFDSNGALYGTTNVGGTSTGGGGGNNNSNGNNRAKGTVFKLAPPVPGGNSSAWTESVLYTFAGGNDGANPVAGVVFDSVGAIYGTTPSGGTKGNGTVFKLTPPTGAAAAWTEAVLYNFGTIAHDALSPAAGIVLDSTGNIYGTAPSGGNKQKGAVFELNPPSTCNRVWVQNILYSFNGQTDGTSPQAGLLVDSSGALYGTTSGGYSSYGNNNNTAYPNPNSSNQNKGTVFKLTQ